MRVTATPARHGPPFSLPFVGPVVGFVIEWDGGCVWLSGDTTWFRSRKEIGKRFRIDVAFLHLGGVGFPLFGPVRFTMGARDAAKAARAAGARTIVPIHYDGWTHFLEPRDAADRAFRDAGLADSARWIPKGTSIQL